MNATDRRLPTATGRTAERGAGVYVNTFSSNRTLVPHMVNAKWRNERNTMKLYPTIKKPTMDQIFKNQYWYAHLPSTSVMYLLHMTTPTTDNIFPTTPTPISKLLPVIWNISAVNKPIAQFGRELLIITRIIPTLLVENSTICVFIR